MVHSRLRIFDFEFDVVNRTWNKLQATNILCLKNTNVDTESSQNSLSVAVIDTDTAESTNVRHEIN